MPRMRGVKNESLPICYAILKEFHRDVNASIWDDSIGYPVEFTLRWGYPME